MFEKKVWYLIDAKEHDSDNQRILTGYQVPWTKTERSLSCETGALNPFTMTSETVSVTGYLLVADEITWNRIVSELKKRDGFVKERRF